VICRKGGQQEAILHLSRLAPERMGIFGQLDNFIDC